MAKENKHPIRIMISGYYGFGNCGDEAILLAIIQQLSEIIPRENITVLSNNPNKTEVLYGVNSIFRLNPFQIFSQMKGSKIFLSGGGGLLQDVSGKGFSIIYYASLLMLAQLLNKTNIVFSQGIGPISNNINKKIIKSTLLKTNLIIVRDEQSQLILGDLGVKKDLISVFPDVSFLLKREALPERINNRYGLNLRQGDSNRGKNIGIVIRNCKAIQKDYEKKVIQIAKIADNLITEYQARLFFIPFQIEDDISLINDITEKMNKSSAVVIEEEIGPSQMLSLFSELSIVIGMRLHAIIFAAINQIPFIAIDYDPKVQNFVNSIGLPQLLLNVDQLTIKNIDNKLKYIYDNQDTIGQTLSYASRQCSNKTKQGIEKLKDFVNQNI